MGWDADCGARPYTSIRWQHATAGGICSVRVLTGCGSIIWLTTTAVLGLNYHWKQSNPQIERWNKLVKELVVLMQQPGGTNVSPIFVVDVYPKSKGHPHNNPQDNVHLDKGFYIKLAQMFNNVLRV